MITQEDYLVIHRLSTLGYSISQIAREMLLDRGYPAEDLPSREALDDPDQLRWAVRRDRLHEKMHVVPVCPNLDEGDVMPRTDLQAYVAQDRVDLCGEDRSAVLRGADDVIQQHRDIMAPSDVLAHPPSLPQGTRQAAGNEPSVVSIS